MENRFTLDLVLHEVVEKHRETIMEGSRRRRPNEWEKVWAYVEEQSGVGLQDLVERLERGKTSISRTGFRFSVLGFVQKQQDGWRMQYFRPRPL